MIYYVLRPIFSIVLRGKTRFHTRLHLIFVLDFFSSNNENKPNCQQFYDVQNEHLNFVIFENLCVYNARIYVCRRWRTTKVHHPDLVLLSNGGRPIWRRAL